MKDSASIERALLSVADKSGLAGFARALDSFGVEILSTGGTRRALLESGLTPTDVAAETGFPEMMDGRVKTLHPRIHGGILGRRHQDADVMAAHGIRSIDLVVVNLYPFARTVAQPGCTLEQAVENIDIGGPAMLRAAAKNHQDVVVVVDPQDYDDVAHRLANREADMAFRLRLALKAFAHTAAYDGAIASYLRRVCPGETPGGTSARPQ